MKIKERLAILMVSVLLSLVGFSLIASPSFLKVMELG